VSTESKIMQVELLKSGFPNDTRFFLGARGSGKTTVIANELRKHDRFVIFDAKNDYSPEFFGGDVFVSSSVADFIDALNRGVLKIIVRVPATEDAADELLSECCNCLMQFQEVNNHPEFGYVVVSVDEMNRFTSSHKCPAGLQRIITTGRDYRIVCFFGAQWFGTLPSWMRDAFTEIYVWKHTDKNGLRLLENFGFNAEEIKNLPMHTCLHAGKNGVETLRLTAVSPSQKQTHAEAVLT
jgi:hypothetical protein